MNPTKSVGPITPLQFFQSGTITHLGIGNRGQGYAWHNFDVTFEGEVAHLCLCLCAGGDHKPLATDDGGYWPEHWSREILEELRPMALRVAMEHGRY